MQQTFLGTADFETWTEFLARKEAGNIGMRLDNTTYMSNCCSARVIDPSGENIEGICTDCGEHCEVSKDDE